jgi:hypothetical protein
VHVRQRADFHDHDARPPIDQSASLVRLLASMGAGTREALWAAQLIERKAAVARWRSGQCGQGSAHPLQRDKRRRT